MPVSTGRSSRVSDCGTGDVPPDLTLRFHDRLVANGQPVVLKVYPDDDHSGTVLASMADSTPFLAARFAG